MMTAEQARIGEVLLQDTFGGSLRSLFPGPSLTVKISQATCLWSVLLLLLFATSRWDLGGGGGCVCVQWAMLSRVSSSLPTFPSDCPFHPPPCPNAHLPSGTEPFFLLLCGGDTT